MTPTAESESSPQRLILLSRITPVKNMSVRARSGAVCLAPKKPLQFILPQ